MLEINWFCIWMFRITKKEKPTEYKGVMWKKILKRIVRKKDKKSLGKKKKKKKKRKENENVK